MLAGWGFGLAGSEAGPLLSVGLDLPTGASVVAAFGAVFALSTVAYLVVRVARRRDGPVTQ